jgi:hypothetical protein
VAYAVLLELAVPVSVLGRLTVVLAGKFSLVYPSVEVDELEELDDPEEPEEPSSFFAQLLKIISVNRIIVTKIIEFFMTISK